MRVQEALWESLSLKLNVFSFLSSRLKFVCIVENDGMTSRREKTLLISTFSLGYFGTISFTFIINEARNYTPPGAHSVRLNECKVSNAVLRRKNSVPGKHSPFAFSPLTFSTSAIGAKQKDLKKSL